jgi:CRP-like cAMP-binding protein
MESPLQALQITPASQNRLLAAIPSEELQRLAPHFQPVPLVFRETLFEAGDPIEFVYFPLSGMISLIASAGNGRSIEVGIVGKDGLTGVPIVLDDDISVIRGVVQAEGSALKLSATIIGNVGSLVAFRTRDASGGPPKPRGEPFLVGKRAALDRAELRCEEFRIAAPDPMQKSRRDRHPQ